MQGFWAAMTDTSAWLIWDSADAPAANLQTIHAETIRPWPERTGCLVRLRVPKNVPFHTGEGRCTPIYGTFRAANLTRHWLTSRSHTTWPTALPALRADACSIEPGVTTHAGERIGVLRRG